MPLLPTMTLTTGNAVSIPEIYTNGLFDPAVTPDTLEILNGGLDLENFGAGNRSIEPRMCQYGSFALGYFSGFTREHAVYADQVSLDIGSNAQQYHTHTSLSAKLFLPWAPSILLYGYQAFFQQDATVWDTDGDEGGKKTELWSIKISRRSGTTVDEKEESRTILPWASSTPDPPTEASSSVSVSDNSEKRWKYVNKHQVETGVNKGYSEFEIRVSPNVKYPNQRHAKVKTVIGGFYALAIR